MKGSKCGLTIPCQWHERQGALFCVEGFTDTAAMTAAGLSAIGRANNQHGAELVAVLLRGWPTDRNIVIVGENDQKPNGDWPGKTGAETVARKLAELLGRSIHVALPPESVKDVREWLTAAARGETPWPERGAELSALLSAVAVVVNPPSVPTDNTDARNPILTNRPEIIVTTEQHWVNAQATLALARETDIYQRGGLLVKRNGTDRHAHLRVLHNEPHRRQ